MERRHMDIVSQRSEEFSVTGVTRFKRWELKSWFEVERLGKNVWRNLMENIEDKSPDTEVLVFEIDNEFVFVKSGLLQKLEDMT
jgi:hypothetical protein